MRKIILLMITIILTLSTIFALDKFVGKKNYQGDNLRKNIYSYLKEKDNRIEVYNAAVALNSGSSANTCVYFLSEVLRKNGVDVPKSVCNTSQLISFLKKQNWEKDSNYKDLKPGDICFTTDAEGSKDGVPTHTYIFMGWVNEGSYDYAYICDNQAKDYNNKVYHIRNIKVRAAANGFSKDAFSFFMKAD